MSQLFELGRIAPVLINQKTKDVFAAPTGIVELIRVKISRAWVLSYGLKSGLGILKFQSQTS